MQGQVSIFEPPLLQLLEQLETCDDEVINLLFVSFLYVLSVMLTKHTQDKRYDLLSCFYRTLNDGVSHRMQSLGGEALRIEGVRHSFKGTTTLLLFTYLSPSLVGCTSLE